MYWGTIEETGAMWGLLCVSDRRCGRAVADTHRAQPGEQYYYNAASAFSEIGIYIH